MSTHSEKVRAGLQEAAEHGRKPGRQCRVTDEAIRAVIHLGTTKGARAVGLCRSQFIARRRTIEQMESSDAE